MQAIPGGSMIRLRLREFKFDANEGTDWLRLQLSDGAAKPTVLSPAWMRCVPDKWRQMPGTDEALCNTQFLEPVDAQPCVGCAM